MHFPELDGTPVLRLFPSRESEVWDTWWDLSPDFVAGFLELQGFDQCAVTYHEQRFLANEVEHSIPFFTVVAGRALPNRSTPT
jgi:hypothetical protein